MSKNAKVIIGVVILLIVIYFGYKWYQKNKMANTVANPPATIKRLANGQLVTSIPSTSAPVYGCYGGVRYIQTTVEGTGNGGTTQFNHGWVTLGVNCKAGDIQI